MAHIATSRFTFPDPTKQRGQFGHHEIRKTPADKTKLRLKCSSGTHRTLLPFVTRTFTTLFSFPHARI